MSDDKPALTAAWYRDGAATTIDGETTWPDATGNGRTLFGVDLAQGSDQQTFTAIESTFATPPKFAPILIPASAPTIGGRTEIDTGAVYEPQRYPSVVGQWTVTREQATPAPWCLTFHRAVSEDEMRQHVADYDRTRITPGADPRKGWSESVTPRVTRVFLDHDDAGYSAKRRAQVRKLPRYQRRLESRRNAVRYSTFEIAGRHNPAWTVVEYEADLPGYNYIPCDVCRWRDPAHRAELTRRAREYAECAQTLVDR